MNIIKFKTRIFETVYFSLFGFLVCVIFFILSINTYDKSLVGFIIILVCSLLFFLMLQILALLCYQYCEYVDGIFIFRCPLYIIKKVKVEDIVKYDRVSIYENTSRMTIIYPVIRIYINTVDKKIKYKYLVNKNSIYFNIYDVKDNYEKFMKIINDKANF
jgi:hypothetical protein